MVVGSVSRGCQVVVIGAGPGGYVAALRLAQLGKDARQVVQCIEQMVVIFAVVLWITEAVPFADGLVVPLASLLGYTLVAALLQINYGFFIESRNKRHLSRVFGQYIPPSLVAMRSFYRVARVPERPGERFEEPLQGRAVPHRDHLVRALERVPQSVEIVGDRAEDLRLEEHHMKHERSMASGLNRAEFRCR